MYNSAELYGDNFFRKRGYLKWRAPIVCGAIDFLWDFGSVIDVGCGLGDLVAGFAELGHDSWGIEGSPACLPYAHVPQDRIMIHDLREPVEGVVTRRYDLLTCFEVIEHLEPERGGCALDNLIAMSDQIVTSISGSTGRYHLHVKPRDFWERKFANRGFERDVDRELELLKIWQPVRLRTGIRCFWDNLICFRKA